MEVFRTLRAFLRESWLAISQAKSVEDLSSLPPYGHSPKGQLFLSNFLRIKSFKNYSY